MRIKNPPGGKGAFVNFCCEKHFWVEPVGQAERWTEHGPTRSTPKLAIKAWNEGKRYNAATDTGLP